MNLADRLVSINRVTKVTKGGRTFSFSAIVVVGNENGVVGYGLGKAKEATAAIAKKELTMLRKNLIKVPVLKANSSSRTNWKIQWSTCISRCLFPLASRAATPMTMSALPMLFDIFAVSGAHSLRNWIYESQSVLLNSRNNLLDFAADAVHPRLPPWEYGLST